MTREQRKIIERHFYNYEKERNEVANYISDLALSNMGVDYSNDRVTGTNKNNVEEKVIRTVDEYDRLYKWCLVWEKTLERFKWTLKDKLMQMRYIDKCHDVCICDQLGICRSNYYYWVEDILQVAFLWAQEFKLF